MFTIAHGSPQAVWCPIVDSDTIYVGQLVTTTAEGIEPLGQASGIADTSDKKVPFGVVIGTNLATPSYDTTYQTDKITDATPLASTTDFRGMGSGPEAMSGRVAMAKVAIITPETVIRGDIFQDSGSDRINLQTGTVTVGSADATSCTVDSGVAGKAATYIVTGVAINKIGMPFRTIYFRSGANKGQYRLEDNNSSVDLRWDKPLYTRCVAGDVVVGVNGLRPHGLSHMQTDSAESLHIDGMTDCSTNNFMVIVHRLDLRESGKEFCEFRFATCHFDPARA